MRAQNNFQGQSGAKVIGATSRGLFLLLPGDRVVFLSVESYAGPLTVNLNQDHPRLHAVQAGMEASIYPKHLEIPKAGVLVDWSEAETWVAPAPPEKLLEPRQRLERLKAVARSVLKENQTGIVPICAPLLGLEPAVKLSAENQSILERALALRKALAAQDPDGALAALQPLFGLGRGLTPSGDDFIEGLLLTLARFRPLYARMEPLDALFQSLPAIGYTQTTALSANLIEMAAQGEADARLLGAVDGIFGGQASVEECARDLLQYGSSSGTDALAGIAVLGW